MDSIPSFLYGKFADVKRETGKVVSRLKKGMPIAEVAAAYDLVEIGTVPGKLILDGPSPLTGGEPHFNMFALTRLMLMADMPYEVKFADVLERFYTDMQQTFWGHMALSTGQTVYNYYGTEARRIAYLRSLIRYKENYIAANGYFDRLPMYGWNLQGEQTVNITSIFDHPHFIAKYVLGNLDIVKAKLDSEEISNLLRTVHLFDLIDQWDIIPHLNGFDNAVSSTQ
jgi:hypothetical protein